MEKDEKLAAGDRSLWQMTSSLKKIRFTIFAEKLIQKLCELTKNAQGWNSNLIRQRILQASNRVYFFPKKDDRLTGLSYEFYRYAQYTATFLPNHIDHFCKNEKPILTLKLKDVNKQMLKCLPQEEKFLPQYVQNIFTDFMDFLCEREGANVKTFFSSHGKQCRDTMSSNNASQEVSTCFAKVFTTVGDRGYVTKDVMCRDVGLVKGCFIGLLDKYCRDFAAFTELNKQFFAHISKPCAACIFGINNVVAFSSVLTALIWGKLFHL
ncbi:hypothetical protein HHI36_007473 [Cryptolaemus montrouzieri]|uniref:Uncharacterized protein n=1 Tax=Cryptolaemus montrouzieri TaxID=559131 RepID=A0ABD2MQ58_9CUCU